MDKKNKYVNRKYSLSEYDLNSAGVLGAQVNMRGQIGAFHSEAMQYNAACSALLLHTLDRDMAIVDGLLHIARGEFTGKSEQDIVRVCEDERMFEETERCAVTADMLEFFASFLQQYGKK